MVSWADLPGEIRQLIIGWLFQSVAVVARSQNASVHACRHYLLSNYLTVGRVFLTDDMMRQSLRNNAEILVRTPTCMASFLPLTSVKHLVLDLGLLCKFPEITHNDLWRPLWCPTLQITVDIGADQVSPLRLPGLLTVFIIERFDHRTYANGQKHPANETRKVGLICAAHCPTLQMLQDAWHNGRQPLQQTTQQLLMALRMDRIRTRIRWPARWVLTYFHGWSDSAVVSTMSRFLSPVNC